jgi:hypothetical protein
VPKFAASTRGALLKLDRASEHRQMVDIELNSYLGREPFTTTGKASVEGPGVDLRMTEPIPEHLAVLIGDCVQNMRVALDYLAWQSALRNHAKPQRFTSFPILASRDGWVGSGKQLGAKRTTCKDVGTDAQAVIESLQPYQQRFAPDPDPLWILNELARVDRHQVLHIAAASFSGTMHTFVDPPRNGNIPLPPLDQMFSGLYVAAGPAVTPEEAGWGFDAPGLPRPQQAWVHVMFDIVFGAPRFGPAARDVAGLPIRQTLFGIENHLRNIVLPRFDALFATGGG